jgi:YVTN family beta-propeller protein
VIDAGTNTVIANIPLSGTPVGGVGVSPDGSRAYVSQVDGVAAIDTSTNAVIATIPINAFYVAVSPNGRPYATITGAVAAIDTATNTVIAMIPVGCCPVGVAASPDGTRIYVTEFVSNTLVIINTATNAVNATVEAHPAVPG